MSEDELEGLIVDKSKINKKRLREGLENIINIDGDTGEPVFLDFHSLTTKDKVIAYLLYRKAAGLLDLLDGETERISSRTISEEIGVNYNTTRSTLSRLNFISRSDEGYWIPNYNLETSLEEIKDE